MKHPSSANSYKKTVKNTLFVLGEVVVKNISEQMSGKFGVIIYDGQISNGVHYLGVFASYELEKDNNISEVEINCLSISPIFLNGGNNDDETKESVTFNAKSHMYHLNIVFQYYGSEDVTSFAVVYKYDSVSVNIALDNIIDIPYSHCHYRNLNLEVEDMHNNDRVLCELVE